MASMGQIIKNLRKERNLTQDELAKQLNVTFQTISKWENETGMPDISQVVPIATVFGVTTDYLFDRDVQPETPNLQLRLVKIEKYDDVNQIIELLRENKVVIVNCESVDSETMEQIKDKIINYIANIMVTQVKDSTLIVKPPVIV